jgi:hypothetical protein
MTRIAPLLLAAACSAMPWAASAENPNACELISIDEVNSFAGGVATRVLQRKSGNPSQCSFEDSRRTAVFMVEVREVQYAAENELQYERENLEKIYRSKVKYVKPLGDGDGSFWFSANKSVMFRKSKRIVTVTFAREKNAVEVDTVQAARLIESRLK